MSDAEQKQPTPIEAEQSNERPIRGGRNLMIMGFVAFVIAFITTAASLYIYRATGDIYLDRSRPGYISEDEKHTETQSTQSEAFASDGAITTETIDEYLKLLDESAKRLETAPSDFSGEPISDDSLGISIDEEPIE